MQIFPNISTETQIKMYTLTYSNHSNERLSMSNPDSSTLFHFIDDLIKHTNKFIVLEIYFTIELIWVYLASSFRMNERIILSILDSDFAGCKWVNHHTKSIISTFFDWKSKLFFLKEVNIIWINLIPLHVLPQMPKWRH